jgi:peptidoglycan-associated lipoprotein
MSVTKRLTPGFLVILLVLVTACASGPKATTAPPEEPSAEREVSLPPIEDEEVISQPVADSVISEEETEELPSDIQELNRRGYLKDVFFDTDRYDLKPEAREILAANSTWLQRFSNIEILIEGHCDERNTREYNLALGERRANAVRDYLVFLGVPASRIRTRSYGEERPFALGHDESAWALNRRAHFVITAS